MEKIIYTNKEIGTAAARVISTVPEHSILCLSGNMGAGKTTFIKALVKQLGGIEQANSPTFGIVNEYHYPNGALLGYHFDFYRLNNPEEALDLGLEEYLAEDLWVFIEWPEKVGDLLPDECIDLHLRILGPVTRKLTLRAI
ncbi:MAG: tRNA (adenosine(37)-N6)-threonylcarbamoyltransferase complex ATPase subunit type 1 TsaE [Flavobacteriaceae bacterium]|nr:tRNA (adenosine(37)-N6)-threonylcarbamoyltransferase complex ATPase subunit type 1 TsaE [Saprospiraceae bacterium]NNL16844.1 tRNA (adenosine(37)-N6)-threonylcarbamoyltransferase complex ATPase subunit type 1 TsaE [Flavobacteriaceae bacterium]